MPQQTNKELLNIISEQVKENAVNQLNFAGQMSTFVNEQKLFNNQQTLINSELKGYLESNNKTNQKGLVEQVDINKKDIDKIKTDKQIEKKVWGVSGAAIGTIAGWIAKLLPFG